MTIYVNGVQFSEDDVTLSYTDSSELRAVGELPVMRAFQLTLPRAHPSYPEIEELFEAAVDLVRDVLEDHVEASPWPAVLPESVGDDDEDAGMGE